MWSIGIKQEKRPNANGGRRKSGSGGNGLRKIAGAKKRLTSARRGGINRKTLSRGQSTVSKLATWDDDDYFDADFSVQKSRRYHAKLRAFYLALSNGTKVASAVSATSAFAFLLSGKPEIATWLAAVIGIVSTFDLVLQFDAKGRLHDDLCKGFTALAAKIVVLPATEQSLQQVKVRRLELEQKEPTERRLVDLQARNEELRSRGAKEDVMVPLSWWQRGFGFVFTFDMTRLERWKAYREAVAGNLLLPPANKRGFVPSFPWSLSPFHR